MNPCLTHSFQVLAHTPMEFLSSRNELAEVERAIRSRFISGQTQQWSMCSLKPPIMLPKQDVIHPQGGGCPSSYTHQWRKGWVRHNKGHMSLGNTPSRRMQPSTSALSKSIFSLINSLHILMFWVLGVVWAEKEISGILKFWQVWSLHSLMIKENGWWKGEICQNVEKAVLGIMYFALDKHIPTPNHIMLEHSGLSLTL